MKLILSGENDRRYQDGLDLGELAHFVEAARAVGFPNSRPVDVELYPATARTTRKGKLKKITVSY